MEQRKYKCEKCNESFDSIRNYINHLELHNENLVEIPEKKEKKSFLKTLFSFSKKKKKKQDVVLETNNNPFQELQKNKAIKEEYNMANEKPEEPKKETEQQNTLRIEALERAINELSTMVTKFIEDNKVEPINDETVTELEVSDKVIEPNNSLTKSVRITVVVSEKEMPSLLKEVQENESYTMENIEVLTK